jgi:hypothetical protein
MIGFFQDRSILDVFTKGSGPGNADFRLRNVDCGQFTGTAEAQRAQSKPNEDSLTSKKIRNTFDVKIKGFLLFTRIIFASLRLETIFLFRQITSF